MLIVLTPPKMLRYEARAIMALLDAGADFIHLRKPGYSSDELQQFLKDIPVAYRGRLSVHYHHRVGREAGLGGLHESGSYQVEGHCALRQSRSCHSLTEAAALPSHFRYAFLSPIFNSISKEGHRAAFKSDELRHFLQGRPPLSPQVVALGGVHSGNVSLVQELGFGGAALLGAVWRLESSGVDLRGTVQNFCEIQALWKKRSSF